MFSIDVKPVLTGITVIKWMWDQHFNVIWCKQKWSL